MVGQRHIFVPHPALDPDHPNWVPVRDPRYGKWQCLRCEATYRNRTHRLSCFSTKQVTIPEQAEPTPKAATPYVKREPGERHLWERNLDRQPYEHDDWRCQRCGATSGTRHGGTSCRPTPQDILDYNRAQTNLQAEVQHLHRILRTTRQALENLSRLLAADSQEEEEDASDSP